MPVRPAFCSICSRPVYVAHSDSLACPVCSTPLLDTVTGTDEDAE